MRHTYKWLFMCRYTVYVAMGLSMCKTYAPRCLVNQKVVDTFCSTRMHNTGRRRVEKLQEYYATKGLECLCLLGQHVALIQRVLQILNCVKQNLVIINTIKDIDCQSLFVFRPVRAWPGSGHRQPVGWLHHRHGDAAAGVAGLPSPGNLAAPLSISTTSLLWVCARWRWLDPTVTKDAPLPITLITSSPK